MGFGIQLLIFGLLWLFMPDYPRKNRDLSYYGIIWSMFKLVATEPVLVQASLNGLFLAGTFMLYWTTLTFLLASPPYEYSSSIIGLFGLIGVAAILTTPWIGKYVIDRWLPLLSTILGSLVVLIGQVIGAYAGKANVSAPILQAWFIDAGISTTQVANRAAIYQIDAKSRNRINSVYMLSVFIGQVMGTGVGAKTYAVGGWLASGSASVGITVLGLLVALSRGPHTKAWVGWTGGTSFKLQTKAGDLEQADRAEAATGTVAASGSQASQVDADMKDASIGRIPDADLISSKDRDGVAVGRNGTRALGKGSTD
ncbi:hypothetical protein ABW19_dt0203655 [Dactylella cylindrospora]|nr:hypothetical protein ABW19_dt0203655 [Dactylella cylindrospora]